MVIGGGAAGLSGALALARARRSVLVIDAGQPRNAPAEHVHNYLGREGTAPAELLATGRAEVAGYGGEVVAGAVVTADRARGRAASGSPSTTARAVRARRLLVATGLVDELPDIPGRGRAVGQRRPALPVLPRLGGARPADRHPRRPARWRCTRRCCGGSGAPTSRSSGTPGRSSPTTRREQLAARGIPVVDGEVAGAGGDRRPARPASGWPRARSSPRAALVVAPRFTARADVLASLGLEPRSRWRCTGTSSAAPSPPDPTGRHRRARGLGGRQRRRPARAGDRRRRRRAETPAAMINADLIAEDTRLAVARAAGA